MSTLKAQVSHLEPAWMYEAMTPSAATRPDFSTLNPTDPNIYP